MAMPAAAGHSWNGYHWANSDGEVQLKINLAITPQWSTSVTTAVADWHSSSVLDLSSATSGANRKKCTAIAGQILVCNELYGQRGWLGIASIWLDQLGHITKGTTKLNDSYFNTARYDTPAWRELVACQEIGHDFGLGHQDENFNNANLNTCMDYTNQPESNRHPNDHDMKQLATIYSHLDGNDSSTLSAVTNFGVRDFRNPAAAGIDPGNPGDSPAEWGRAVHNDGLDRPDVFVQDLPGGGRKITHVFWALETKQSEIHHD